ncbi:MAG: hypothetical protein ACFFAJ_03845 [Candidatus Hodarchaeota archaeon]
MQYYMSVSEIQDRLKTLISHFSGSYSSRVPYVNSRLVASFQKMIDPNLLNNEKVAEEIITVFLNSIILAGQLGIDIERKINEYLIQLEREAILAM